MTKIGDKEDPLRHIQKHIDTAASRAARASALIAEVIAQTDGVRLSDVVVALESVEGHVRDALRHIRQYKP